MKTDTFKKLGFYHRIISLFLIALCIICDSKSFGVTAAELQNNSEIEYATETTEETETVDIGVGIFTLITTHDDDTDIQDPNTTDSIDEIIMQDDLKVEENTQEEKSQWYDVELYEEPLIQYTYSKLNVRLEPTVESECLGKISAGGEINVIGRVINTEDTNWVKIIFNDTEAFVCSLYVEDENFELSTYNYDWTGEKLNKKKGIVSGPSGKESFYNLNMSRCVSSMKSLGFDYEYWVREDGVKMYGPYVMVAADLSIRPKGSLVDTTLGTGIVVDTGSFVQTDSTKLDIAVSW